MGRVFHYNDRGRLVIILTRLDKSRLLVNIETVKYVESTPDTLITFLNGDNLLVRESLEEIDQAVVDYRVRTLKLVSESSAT